MYFAQHLRHFSKPLNAYLINSNSDCYFSVGQLASGRNEES